MTTTFETAIEEIAKRFPIDCADCEAGAKDWLRTTLENIYEAGYHARTEEVVKIAEGMKKNNSAYEQRDKPRAMWADVGYDQALTDLIAALTPKVSNND